MLQKTKQAIPAPTTQQEIEIKIKPTPQGLEQIERWLGKNATFQGEAHHKEVYLDNPNSTFFFTHSSGEKDALKYLRVRFLKNGGSVCFKDWHEDLKTGKTTHCDEYETNVSSPDAMLALFEQLGYTDKTWMEKTRRTFRTGEYEVVIDDVKNLGMFVEIELKQSSSDVKASLQQLENFLVSTIDVTEYWIQTRGYASKLRNPDIEFGEYRNHRE